MRVQVTIRGTQVAALAVLAMLPATAADALTGDPTIGYTFNFYSDVNGVNVYSQYTSSSVRLKDGVSLSAEWNHDRVVFPAIDAPPGSQEAVDAITTASRPITGSADAYQDYVKVRNSVEGNVTWRGYQAGYYVSSESDYFAQMVTFSYNRGFMNDNLNLATGVSYSWDHITPLADSDTQDVPDYRRTLHFNAVATQVLTKTTVARLGTEFNHVQGLQHDPYRNVYVAGANVPERTPTRRQRDDVFAELNQYINNRSSVNVDYRYYTDDWGVSSNTVGIKLNQYINDQFIVRYRYRYYTQVAADFFRRDYTVPGGVNGFQTGDYRLGDFGAHLFGGRVLWHPRHLPGFLGAGTRGELMFSYERYFNSNNFSADVIETGLQIAF
jgi:Protein of unknown function (DUF3570)